MSNINNIIQKSIFEAFLSLRVFVLALLESYAFLTLNLKRKERGEKFPGNKCFPDLLCVYLFPLWETGWVGHERARLLSERFRFEPS